MTMTMVLPSPGSTRLQPLDAAAVHVTDGFWRERLETNRARTIPHGLIQLEASGALGNFRNAARESGRYIGGLDDAGITFPFLDSDVYKWLEAAGWELGRGDDAGLAASAHEVIELIAAAQRADGYLGTFVQLSAREPYGDLEWGHELYCIGHLIQAAIAWQRSLADGRLMAISARAIDHVESELGAGRREGIDGHPEIEMALVELFRTTGEERYLALARLIVERRGTGLLGSGRLGARYWQDHAPVSEAPTVAGHTVRQLYLDCGVTDLAVETADGALLEAVIRRWSDMWANRTYLTGALGSRHRDEAFGDPMELPPDRAYAETCAAIASVMLSWRLLLATGEDVYADAIERTLYNAVLPGLSLDGTNFFYTNPLQLRERPGATGTAAGSRAAWYPCACCPPNLMRTLSSFEQVIATRDDAGIQLQQLASGTVETHLDGESIRLRVDTKQPWMGRVDVTVDEAPGSVWTLRVRVPTWVRSATLTAGEDSWRLDGGPAPTSIKRAWRAGDRMVLDMSMPPRLTFPNRRIDAVRGCVAVERGPLVYCLEQTDLPDGLALDDLELDLTKLEEMELAPPPSALPAATGIRVPARAMRDDSPSGWPYRERSAEADDAVGQSVALTMVPYFAWANRTPGPMRVWLPTAGIVPATQAPPARDD